MTNSPGAWREETRYMNVRSDSSEKIRVHHGKTASEAQACSDTTEIQPDPPDNQALSEVNLGSRINWDKEHLREEEQRGDSASPHLHRPEHRHPGSLQHGRMEHGDDVEEQIGLDFE